MCARVADTNASSDKLNSLLILFLCGQIMYSVGIYFTLMNNDWSTDTAHFAKPNRYEDKVGSPI